MKNHQNKLRIERKTLFGFQERKGCINSTDPTTDPTTVTYTTTTGIQLLNETNMTFRKPALKDGNLAVPGR